MDVVAVKGAGEKAVAHARAGKGPYILEMLTYRYRGHSMSGPGQVPLQGRGPKKCARSATQSSACVAISWSARRLDEAQLKEIDRQIKELVSEAADFAQASPEPDPSELYTDVYA